MRNQVLIGLGLGLVSAVAFVSATTGQVAVRYVLFLLTSLPLFLAGLGWGCTTAAIAGLCASAIIAMITGLTAGLTFAATQVVPAVALTYLALLNRPVAVTSGDAKTSMEWYPPGRLLLWAAVLAGIPAVFLYFMLGGDLAPIKDGVRNFIEGTVNPQLPKVEAHEPLTDEQVSALADMVVAALPAALAISWMSALLLNLWLAGRITLASGQLARPWPDLAQLQLPRGSSLPLLAAIGGSMLGGGIATASAGFLGAFLFAFVLLGLAVIHYMTRGRTWRPFALWGLYIGLLFVHVGFAIPIAILGLLDSAFDFRGLSSGNSMRSAQGPGSGGPTKI